MHMPAQKISRRRFINSNASTVLVAAHLRISTHTVSTTAGISAFSAFATCGWLLFAPSPGHGPCCSASFPFVAARPQRLQKLHHQHRTNSLAQVLLLDPLLLS